MNRLEKLKEILRGLRRVAVAYSGGLDSTFLLKMAIDTLGKDNCIAVTARSATYPDSEYRRAVVSAKSMGARHIVIRTNELSLKNFRSNPVNRCYYCKKELFTRLKSIGNKYGICHVVDGTNLDDLDDIRYGSKAAAELGVKRPLLEARMTKDDIRRASKKLKLTTWDKPSSACLASRVPFNNIITKNGLERIGKAEEYMRDLGFKQVRVRLHNNIARIEVPEKDLKLGMKFKTRIIDKLKKLRFFFVRLL